jgi:thymidylate kinase
MNGRGFTVALIGCDGAGKTTVGRALERESGLPIRYMYMGVNPGASNYQLPTTRLAHRVKQGRNGRPASRAAVDAPARPASRVRRGRRAIRSTLRLANRLAEEWYRQLLATFHRSRGRIVVFDRHFVHDYHAADVAAADRTLARRLHGFVLTHLYPKPDLVIFLDAPPEVLFARKGEGTLASLALRREEYQRLGTGNAAFAVVEATQPLETVVGLVASIIRGHGEAP